MKVEEINKIVSFRPTHIYMKAMSKSPQPLYDSVIKSYKLTKQSIIYDRVLDVFLAEVDRGYNTDRFLKSLILRLHPREYNIIWSINKTKLKKKKCYFANLQRGITTQLFLFNDGYYDVVSNEFLKKRSITVSTIALLDAAIKYCNLHNYVLKIRDETGTEISYAKAEQILEDIFYNDA